MLRATWIAAAAVLVLLLCASRPSIADPPQTESPFNVQDPEIQALKKLNWKDVDFNAQPPLIRCQALLALGKLLDMTAGKAEARADLLSDYLEQNKLGEEYAADAAAPTDKVPLTYEDAKKVAAAFMATPRGKARFGDDLEGCSDQLLLNYQGLYNKTCTRKWDEVIESRAYVKSMAQFLQRKGKWEEYLKWSDEEANRRQQEYQAQQKAKQAAYAQAMQEKRDKALNEAQRRVEAERQAQAEQQAAALQGLDYTMTAQSSGNDGGYDDGSSDWGYGGTWGWGGNAYYVNGAYRAAARERYTNRVEHWQGGGRGRGRVGGRR
ncbi:MAG TPA: hypothetical protein VH475_11355 [Tepidisphaeraceae bacterium]|jgi:hypothetical protein